MFLESPNLLGMKKILFNIVLTLYISVTRAKCAEQFAKYKCICVCDYKSKKRASTRLFFKLSPLVTIDKQRDAQTKAINIDKSQC